MVALYQQRYNRVVARGWESKSVEGQMDALESERGLASKQYLTAEQIERQRQRESLLLSRTRVLREIEQTRVPRRRAILEAALAHLQAKLESMP